ncbi:holo-ACP synthase [Streptococcus sp. zg-JUN1979]|uniref:holo-ACP synthase n=1 Tax=Streptococcus sp. zg-JUN1979 TaxID=3391450 RepID=UPI0039A6B90E
MIVGHGIDIQEIDAIWQVYEKKERFLERLLTPKERTIFNSFTSSRRQATFLAGRWAAKEAFSKAMGTGIGKLSFKDIEVLNDRLGAPFVNQSPFSGKVWLSISHSGNVAQASVILEEEK